MADKQGFLKKQTKNLNDGLLKEIYQNVRLILRLLKDSRVNTLLKLLPVGALLYLLMPADLIPINPIDDGLVLWLGGYLFIELCPDEVVEEHRRMLRQSPDSKSSNNASDEVIDGDFKDLS